MLHPSPVYLTSPAVCLCLLRPCRCSTGKRDSQQPSVCIQFIRLWSAAFFFSSPQLGFSPVHRPGSADGKQPRSCAHELPAGHIPAACTVIPPRALSLQNQFSERKRKEKIRDRAIYPTKSGKGRYRQITLIIITNNSNNAKLLSPCGAGRCLASCVDYFTLDQVSF